MSDRTLGVYQGSAAEVKTALPLMGCKLWFGISVTNPMNPIKVNARQLGFMGPRPWEPVGGHPVTMHDGMHWSIKEQPIEFVKFSAELAHERGPTFGPNVG